MKIRLCINIKRNFALHRGSGRGISVLQFVAHDLVGDAPGATFPLLAGFFKRNRPGIARFVLLWCSS